MTKNRSGPAGRLVSYLWRSAKRRKRPYWLEPAPWLRPTGAWLRENNRTKSLSIAFGFVKRVLLQGGGHYYRATVTPPGSLLPCYYGGGTAREAQAKAQRP